MDSIPKLKPGDPRHVQGFIIYKLWMKQCWARGGQHNRSIDLEHDLPTSYPRQHAAEVLKQAEELKKIGLITYWPAAGGRKAVAAVPSKPALEAAIPIVNDYLVSVGENPIEGDIREALTGKRSEKKEPLTPEELRKFARLHKRQR